MPKSVGAFWAAIKIGTPGDAADSICPRAAAEPQRKLPWLGAALINYHLI